MLEDAAAKRDRADDHRQRQADFVDDRAARGNRRPRRAGRAGRPSRRNAPGTGPTGPSQSGRAGWSRMAHRHRCARYRRCRGQLQYIMTAISCLAARPAARIGAPHGRRPRFIASPADVALDQRGRAPCPTCCSSSPHWCSRWWSIGGITRLTESGLSITEWNVGQRRHPAAHPRRLESRVRSLPGDAAISRGRRAGRDDARRLQVHLLLGMGPPACSAGSSASSSSPASPGSPLRRAIPKGYRLAARGIVRPRRAAGRGRLVHGHVGPRGPDRGQPLSPVGASAVRAVPVRAR